MRKFYSHLVEIESLTIELEKLDLADHEKHELAGLLDSNIHNAIMDAILSKVPEAEKKRFAEVAAKEDHDKIWEFLKSKSENIEHEIKKAAADVKKRLHEDIKEAQKK
jgi:predicted nucleotidyltransferase